MNLDTTSLIVYVFLFMVYIIGIARFYFSFLTDIVNISVNFEVSLMIKRAYNVLAFISTSVLFLLVACGLDLLFKVLTNEEIEYYTFLNIGLLISLSAGVVLLSDSIIKMIKKESK